MGRDKSDDKAMTHHWVAVEFGYEHGLLFRLKLKEVRLNIRFVFISGVMLLPHHGLKEKGRKRGLT